MNLQKILIKRILRSLRFDALRAYHNVLNQIECYKLLVSLNLGTFVSAYSKRSWAQHEFIRYGLRVKYRQNSCTHLKGGPAHTVFKDFNVFDHVYIDGTRVIGCMGCRKKWTPASRDWNLALEMKQQSSNGPTASEVPAAIITVTPEGKKLGYKSLLEANKAAKN